MAMSSRAMDMGDPCTPMAWQQRDLNYHQSGFQDRYGPGAIGRAGPPSTSDRLSHHTDKSWRTQRDSRDSSQPHLVPYAGGYPSGSSSQYATRPPPAHYPPSRPSYSSGRPPSRPHTPSGTTSSSSSSSSEDDSEQAPGPGMAIGTMPHPIYGYYPGGYPPGPPHHPAYPGTLKSARSVPALALATWDGEPCPVHGSGPLSFPGPHGPHGPLPPPGYPPMMPHGALSLPPPSGASRRVNSIYDMRLASPPGAMYGTLPGRTLPADRRSLAGSAILGPAAAGAPPGIPPHLLPPMARPLPLVVDEKGNPEPLPVRKTADKNGTLPPGVVAKVAASVGQLESEAEEKNRVCCRGGACVAWVILAVICLGVLLAVMLRFIL
ncbi:atrophin-1 isoform X2 [Procambarus clarkii]|nr:basic proline-rich protein-like isoform X2 [Procambarus clarkii]